MVGAEKGIRTVTVFHIHGKKFKELYGISCKEYICRVRIAKVEHYLRFTNEDLTYVSQETGYSDCSHMIKEFKAVKGITPGKYRRECRCELPPENAEMI